MKQLPFHGNFRWVVCALLFAATTINYIDRQILSLLKPILDAELHWTNEQFGWINSFFQGAYAISYLFFGWFIDKYGSKIGYAVSISVWSLAALAHSVVGSFSGFAIARIALGLGEGGNFPAAIKSVAQWFPKKDRAFATTLFNSGANIGALMAPATIPWIAQVYGWQMAFIVAGIAGFIWLIAWWALVELPQKSKFVSSRELGYIQSDREESSEAKPVSIGALLRLRATWAFLAAKILTDPVWWFFLIWLPDYFKTTRHLDLKAMGLPLVMIYTMVTVLSIVGGWFSKVLIERGWSTHRTRKVCLFIFASCVLPVVAAPRAEMGLAIFLIGLAGAAHQAWSATILTTVSDMYPQRAVASMIGPGGMAGSIGGMIFPVICGKVLDHFTAMGYGILFAFCGSAYLLSFFLHHWLVPRIEPLRIGEEA